MMKLLLVEDSELIRARLLSWIEPLSGITHIDAVHTLAQTLEHVHQHSPDLLILDLSLPDGNAVHRINTLRAMAPDMVIAIYTNDTSDFTRDKCLHAGADWFFDKSREFHELMTLVRQEIATCCVHCTP